MSLPDANDLLMGGGIPAAKFPTIGTVVKGTVKNWETTQQTDFDTGKPLFWDDGKPRLQVVITIQTDERDPEVEHDDGLRKLYVKGQMQKAVSGAIRAAGRPGLEVGAQIAVQFNSEEPQQRGNPKKVYVAQYAGPDLTAGPDLLGAAAAPAPAAQPAAPASSLL